MGIFRTARFLAWLVGCGLFAFAVVYMTGGTDAVSSAFEHESVGEMIAALKGGASTFITTFLWTLGGTALLYLILKVVKEIRGRSKGGDE